jgi:mono/diheme cytochrome c family protein
MAIARATSSIAAVLGVSLVLAACGGETGGTTTVATKPAPVPEETTSSTPEKTTTAKEETAKEKTAPKKTTSKPEAGGNANAAAKQGEQVFTANGCAACHTLAAANADGTVGPNLDETLPGKSKAYINEAIVDPNATVAPGYSAGIMPPTFGSTLSSSELEALVAFLQQSAGK